MGVKILSKIEIDFQAIYDATGIPLEEDDLSVGRYGTQWWLELHRYPVFPIGEDPNRHASITLVKRKALTRGMEQRLSEALPEVKRILEDLGGSRAAAISMVVRCTQDSDSEPLTVSEFDRGWPHFSLQLSTAHHRTHTSQQSCRSLMIA